MRRRVERLHTVPAIGGGLRHRAHIKPVHFSISGGRTLNFAVSVPRGRVASAVLVLTHGTHRVELPLEVEPQADGTALLTATTPLRYETPSETGRRGPMLTSGLWKPTLVLTDPQGETRRAVVTAFAEPAADGPTRVYSPSPTSGALFRIVRSVDGFALIKVRAPRRHAEFTDFELRWDRVTVYGRVYGFAAAEARGKAEMVLRRGGGAPVSVTPEWEGDRFRFDVPFDRMGGVDHARVWELFVRVGGQRLKISRQFTDVRYPRRVFRTPIRIIALDNGSLMRVHAYVAGAGALVVSCVDVIPASPSTEEVA
ncbi:hypothetical protein [Streptomyces roseolus]|uniref:hypothetical protein n=1 Tax=Streptomyces roseolus TaxID=67358 RepID=UPI0016793D6B|nr:hypothetical protein [Streptomyces roseolus]